MNQLILQEQPFMLTVVRVYKDLYFIKLPDDLGVSVISKLNLISLNIIRKTPHSYDGTGRILLWFPDIVYFRKIAVDFEHTSREVKFISQILGTEERIFLQNWVCNEVVAKLLNMPMLKLLKDNNNKLIRFIENESIYHISIYNDIHIFYFRLDNLQAHIAFGVLY